MRGGSWALGVILVGACTTSGCSSRTCPTIGCVDAFSATVRSADGSFPSGAHRVEVLVDASSLTCSFMFPLPMTGGAGTSPACDVGMTVAISAEEACTDTMEAGGVSHSCTPIPGKFFETIGLSGTPGQVHVWQYVDDAAILDAAAAPTYQNVAPNGSECGPVCRQATASWTFN